ncbi:putative O-methyltransferase YrrM [Pontibacter ummariensis]|uniref:Predicted O-methyltransferase YrrM n=1 Tax=Pontibacter ummariensis TaxID=1610492 RepID=A0A239BBQ4_9BACT|nr:O-methyltransferase [Pontibacter ummariensis]PRY16421.1 putative O-methyltransferase YrrM [Pontibacter ummariensis]SNS04868.1 Predicted O-methyltransferase YrrM [Pontibacter ummariensis]
MDFIDDELLQYAEEHTSPESELLHKVNRQTHLNVLKPRMLSGHLQGRLLSLYAKMIQPKQILEVGTYTGYSALCMAEGLRPDGTLHTIDINEELEERVRGYFQESGYGDRIQYYIGNALEIIPTIAASFDLVFLDADKINYGAYYDLVIDKINPGGYLIADNVLWSGKVLAKYRRKLDEDTQAVLDFNQKVHADERVENILLPVRDGLMIARKK